MQDRLDIFYDKIDELEEAIIEVNKKINCANDEQFTTESLCKALLNFDIMYDKMSDADKKQFFQSFIKTIEIDADSASEDRLLKHILFKFPVSIDIDEGENLLPKENDVETICLLSKGDVKSQKLRVEFSLEDMDTDGFKKRATYNAIRDWIKEKYGYRVTNLNIAQVKQKHGIIERENYNKPKSPDSKQPGCSEEKIKAIEDAMRHFQMI